MLLSPYPVIINYFECVKWYKLVTICVSILRWLFYLLVVVTLCWLFFFWHASSVAISKRNDNDFVMSYNWLTILKPHRAHDTDDAHKYIVLNSIFETFDLQFTIVTSKIRHQRLETFIDNLVGNDIARGMTPSWGAFWWILIRIVVGFNNNNHYNNNNKLKTIFWIHV